MTAPPVRLDGLTTESRNESTLDIDRISTLALVQKINEEDKKVAAAVEQVLPAIAEAVDLIVSRLQNNGRLFYIGAGTSGRLGILDAAECPPTYRTSPDMVQGIIAGGMPAMFASQEGAEDSPDLAADDLAAKNLTAEDVVVGLAASGRTPYVIGALEFARRIGAATIAVACNDGAPIAKLADIPIIPVVGAEAVTGSTRMKAGTAQKLILNMLSTGAMIKLGKVYSNLMVDVKASNLKLKERACRIVEEATGASRSESEAMLLRTGDEVKLAIFMLLSKLEMTAARDILGKNQGYITRALQSLSSERERFRNG